MTHLRTQKHADGLWHYVAAEVGMTLCARPTEPQRQGRPGRATCEYCVTAAASLPLIENRVAAAPPPPLFVLPVDPPPRADGRCVQCRQPRKLEQARRYAGGHVETDPFCSTGCCRAYHGVATRPGELADAEVAA